MERGMKPRSVLMMHLERGGSISPDHWKNLKPDALEAFIEGFVQYYNKEGYPFNQYNEREKRKMFGKLTQLHVDSMIDKEGIVHQNFCAQGLSWSYFPHSLSVACKRFSVKNHQNLTVTEVLADKKLLRIALKGVLRMAESANSGFSHRSFANHLKISRGTQHVSNFRPSAAKALYQRYARNKVVWDMSCGFGGRLLGAMTAPVKKYIGTDPSTATMDGLLRIKKELGGLSPTMIDLHKLGSEDFIPDEPVDFCFTSPPYFDTEKYSLEETQSYIKYPDADSWLNVFIKRTTKNCLKCLRPGGILAFNIHAGMEKDFMKLCKHVGFRHLETLQLRLSRMPGKGGRTAKTLFKNEPILVFEKKGD